VSLYFISRNRKLEFEVEMKVEPKEDESGKESTDEVSQFSS
jgi:hypothetical protein